MINRRKVWEEINLEIRINIHTLLGFPGGADGKESARNARRLGFDSWIRKISWSRKQQPTPVFLPEEFHGQRSLVGYSPWGHKEMDMTEGANTYTHYYI